jgi:hypothetical protein
MLKNTLLHDQWFIEEIREAIKSSWNLMRMKAQTIKTYGTQQYSWQGIDNQNMQVAQKTKVPKNEWPNEEMGKELNWSVQKKKYLMAQNHRLKCSTFMVINEMQI